MSPRGPDLTFQAVGRVPEESKPRTRYPNEFSTSFTSRTFYDTCSHFEFNLFICLGFSFVYAGNTLQPPFVFWMASSRTNYF
ncbi:hypothetical protein [Phaffia rhodozyma]|uniref:Uncharacterized protein n=1 Tax=Phaffia rhodozyma TaxID=264483 RepID=A0A0F7SPT1_PHARH|nr:hypothetical protein [Phaffia rhodozyma]